MVHASRLVSHVRSHQSDHLWRILLRALEEEGTIEEIRYLHLLRLARPRVSTG